jgi:transcriptional regulator with XRE-family HTH domain
MPVPDAARRLKSSSPEAAFGRALRAARKSCSLSQDELGAKSGYHRTYIGLLERGEKSPSLRTIFNLAATLNVKPSALIRDTERIARLASPAKSSRR